MYICYENGVTIQSKSNWLKWYELNGDKGNFDSAIDWFDEMVDCGILVEM